MTTVKQVPYPIIVIRGIVVFSAPSITEAVKPSECVDVLILCSLVGCSERCGRETKSCAPKKKHLADCFLSIEFDFVLKRIEKIEKMDADIARPSTPAAVVTQVFEDWTDKVVFRMPSGVEDEELMLDFVNQHFVPYEPLNVAVTMCEVGYRQVE